MDASTIPTDSLLAEVQHAILEKQRELNPLTKPVKFVPTGRKARLESAVDGMGARELYQNFRDALKHAIAEAARRAPKGCRLPKIVHGQHSVGWALVDAEKGDELFGEVSMPADGVDLKQVTTLPLSVDAIITGTQSKGLCGDEDDGGGFGDGLKSAMEWFLARGYEVRFIFTNYDADEVCTWTWELGKLHEQSMEEVMGIRVDVVPKSGKKRAPSRDRLPTMVTRITHPDADKVADLHKEMAAQLGRMATLVYEVSESGTGDAQPLLAMEGKAGLLHASRYTQAITHVGDVQVPMPRGPLIEAAGILYDAARGSGLPHDLIVRIRGNGLPESQMQVFPNNKRQVDAFSLVLVLARLFRVLSAARETTADARLHAAFMPLLEGGSSLMIAHGKAGSTVNSMLGHYPEIRDELRLELVYLKLVAEAAKSPSPTRLAKLRDQATKAIIAEKDGSAQANYLALLLDRPVVHIDVRRADSHVFMATSLIELEREAGPVLVDAAARSKGKRSARAALAEPFPPALQKAINYITDSTTAHVVRVVRPGTRESLDAQPYDFVAGSNKAICVWQPKLDEEDLMMRACTHLRESAGEAARAIQFVLAFMGDAEINKLTLNERVAAAINKAKHSSSLDPMALLAKARGPPNPGEAKGKAKAKGQQANNQTVSLLSSDEEEGDDACCGGGLKSLNFSIGGTSGGGGKRRKVDTACAPQAERARKTGFTGANRRVRGSEPPEEHRIQRAVSGSDAAAVAPPQPCAEPTAETPVDLCWSTEHAAYVEAGAQFVPPEGFGVMQDCFKKALRAVVNACDTNAVEGCDFFAVWSPAANWRGQHTQGSPVSLVQINLAAFPGLEQGVGSLAWFKMLHTFCHELAHEDSRAHDMKHEHAIKEHREALAFYLHTKPVA